MKNTVVFAHSIGDKVMLAEIQRPGRVDQSTVDFSGVMYRVAYWDNSERKTVWVYADEITERK